MKDFINRFQDYLNHEMWNSIPGKLQLQDMLIGPKLQKYPANTAMGKILREYLKTTVQRLN